MQNLVKLVRTSHSLLNKRIYSTKMSRVPLRVSAIVSTDWLWHRLASNTQNMRVLDCSWHKLMPFSKRDALQEFYREHIPGAQFFDIDKCCDQNSPYPHMIPTAEEFEKYVGKLGISNSTHVVCYDNSDFGLFSAQRVWWLFRLFGHTLVSVLDGGFPKWNREQLDIDDEVQKLQPQIYKAELNADLVKSYEQMQVNLTSKEMQVIDARPAGRFEGTTPEPRPEVKPGHMVGSVNIPFTNMLDNKAKVLRSAEEIKEEFEKAGIDLNKPCVASCGSGVSACMIALGAHLCGKTDLAIYDGSWTEWYQRASHDQKECVPK